MAREINCDVDSILANKRGELRIGVRANIAEDIGEFLEFGGDVIGDEPGAVGINLKLVTRKMAEQGAQEIGDAVLAKIGADEGDFEATIGRAIDLLRRQWLRFCMGAGDALMDLKNICGRKFIRVICEERIGHGDFEIAAGESVDFCDFGGCFVEHAGRAEDFDQVATGVDGICLV